MAKTSSMRELARKYGVELPEEKEKVQNPPENRFRDLAARYGVEITEDKGVLTARAKKEEDSVSSSTRTSRGETNRSQGKRWLTGRPEEDIRSEISRLDEQIYNLKGKVAVTNVPYYKPTKSAREKDEQNKASLSALETSRDELRGELLNRRTTLKSASDFAEKSTPNSSLAAVDETYRLINYPEGYDYERYKKIAEQGDADAVRSILESATDAKSQVSSLKDNKQYVKNMTADERQTYNYLYATEGKESADEYLGLIETELLARRRKQTDTEAEIFAGEHPVLSSLYTVASKPAAAAAAVQGTLQDYVTLKDIDVNAPHYEGINTSSKIREKVSHSIEKNWGKVGSFAYDLGMSMADFLAPGILSNGSAVNLASFVLTSSAAAESTISAAERGVDDTAAIAYGVLTGAAEYFLGKGVFDNLFSSPYWGKSAWKYILSNSGSEALEEGGTSIVDVLGDVIFSRDKSEWQQSINAYTEQGFSKKDAVLNTLRDTAAMVGLDAIGGLIGGAAAAAGGVAVGKIGQGAVNRENVRQGRETIRTAVNEQRQSVRDAVDNPETFIPDTPTGAEPISSRVSATAEGEEFEIGREVRRDQLMTIEQQERADAIDNADDLDATAIKYEATPRQRNEARELSDLTGYGIEFFRQKNPDGSVKHGLYDTPSGKIYLNVNSNRTVPVTVGHEIMHTLEGTAAYDDVHDYVLGALQSEGKNIEAERARIKKLYEQAGVTLAGNKQIDADMVAEYVGTELLDNIQALRDVYRAKPSLGQKITRAVDKLLIRATGMQDQTVTAYLERLSAMQHRVDEIVEKSEEEINRRLDEKEAAQTEAAPAGEGMPQTAAPAVPKTAPVQTSEMSETPKSASEEQRKPSETVSERRTAPQTGGTVSGGTETRSSGTETQEAARTSMDESARADMMLDELNQRYENGEISDEEYDEAYELIEEARMTGRGLESSADVVDYPEGRIPEWVRGKAGAIREKLGIKPKEPVQYSISAEEVEDRVSSGRPVEAADEVQWSISNDASYMDAAEQENEKNRYVPYNVMAKARSDRETIRKIFTDPRLADSLNLPPDNIGNTYIPNGSYDGTEENTTVCIRSMAADALMDAVAEHLGRPLTVEDTITVSQEYWQYTDQPECLYCYVAMDRKAYREFLGSYLEQRNNALADLRSGMSKEEAYRRFLDGRVTPKNPNGTKPMRDRFDSWVRYMENGTEMITEADLASEKSMQDAAARSPELAAQINDARKYAQGASWAKKRIGYTAYNNHILKWTPDRIRKLNSQFGLRLYSFSDFSPAFILENMQMITDASVRGLKMLAYTKDINFAKIFAPSGININISTFAYEGADGSMVQDGMQGADWAEAQAMRDQFENVGITFVAVNDAQVDWAIAQDWIDVVIPFHLVRTGAKVAESFGWKNYTQMSGDVKTKDWTKGDKKSIYPSEHQNDRERYFEALRKNHLEPRFRDWADDPNYMKLVNETRRSAGETPAVQPVFDVDAAKAAIDEMRKRGGYYVPVGKTDENMRDIAGEIAEKIRSDEGDVQWSISAEEKAQPTENAMLVDRYAGMEGQNNIFRDLLWRHNQRMVDAIVAHRRQTKTKKFREWFGKSTVINNDGEPMVVFRGTSATTAKLDHNDKPIWFSNNVMYAKAYSDETTLQDKFRMSSRIFGGTEMKIIPAYLRAVNPADFGDTDGSFVEKLSELSRNLMIPEDELREVWDKTGGQETVWKTLHTTEMKNLLSSYGYDSVKAVEYGVDTWGVFSSSQVKSALANNGKFNPNRSDIRYSISEDEDTTPYGGLPVKAQNRVRDLERKFGIAVDKMFGLGMTYKSPDFRAFLQSNVRPLVNAYLENGIIPEKESDALFAQFFDPATGADEALQKQEFYKAFEEMEEGLFNVARWSQSQTAVPETDREESPIPTTEEAEQLFAAQRDARREMDKVMYRVLLKPEDEVTVGKLLRGELSPDQVTENRADILEAYRVQKAFRDADAAVSVYKKRLKAELYKHVDKYLGNIAQWKDKRMPLMYQRETMERNIRDIIPDKAEADAFIAEFITPVHRAEAQRQRFLGEYRERVKKLNLSTKVQEGNQQSEAYAVQFLGEAADNIRILSLSGKRDQQRDGHTLEEWKAAVEAFWAANPNMNRAKIERAIGEFRQIYNELLPKLNEVRIRNGYAPVAFRQGYFPHFTATSEDTVLARILRPFGIEFNADALPTSINGLTADFKPGITYFQFGNERLGFETTYDALQGYEMYLNAASDVIYHTDNIQKLRALAARIRYLTGDEGIKQQIDKVRNNDTLDEAEKQVQLEEIYRKGRYRMSNFVITMDEYTNGLANKKSRFDRGVEELFGRPAYSVMKALESRVAANMIAGNIGSALTNIIPLNQANAIIGNVNVLKGMYHTIHGMAVHDGFAAASDFLTNRRGADPLVRTTGQKISDAASIPMNLIDGFVSETIVRAAYIKNLADGMGEDLALQHADALAASIMADRSKGALPVLFNARNPLMKLFTQFQVEVNNEYSVIFKDIPELAKANSETKAGAIARITGMLFRYFVGAWLFNELYERLFGRRAALDPVGMIANTVGSVAEGEDVGKALQTLGTEAVESLPFVGGVLGGGRVPIQSAIPDFADLTMAATSDTWTGEKKALTAFEELSKPAAYLLPPFLGGQINKTLRGIAAAAQGGVYGIEGDEDGGAYLKYPVYDDPLDVTRSVLFGTTYTEGGREWVESGFKSLSVSQTAAYQAMKEFGADDRAAFDLIQEYKAVPEGKGRTAAQRDVIRTADIPGEAKFAAYYNLGASDSRKELMDSVETTEPRGKLGEAAQVLMDISDIGSGKTAGTCDLLAQSGLSEDTKKLIYRKEVSDQKDDDIRAAELVGISFDEYLDAHAAYSTLYNNKTLSKSEQALEFSRYVEGANLTAMQKETLREIFKYYSQVPVSAKNYNELRSIGVSDDYAAKIVREIDNLEPLPGKKSVSEVQKARVVVDEISDPDERLAALGTVLSDTQYRKVSIAADAGLDPEVWVALREVLPEFDSDNNGSYTQEEMEDAIRAFSSGTSYGSTLMKQGRNLSRDEMAILWQIGGNWKSANNPFSKPTGKKVKDLLDAEKKG